MAFKLLESAHTRWRAVNAPWSPWSARRPRFQDGGLAVRYEATVLVAVLNEWLWPAPSQ